MGLQETPGDPAAVAARDAAVGFYAAMEQVLSGHDYLAGPDYTFTDIAFYMAQLFGDRMGAGMSKATPRLLRWRERITARLAVRQVAAAMASYLASQGRPVPDYLSALVA